MRQVIKGDGSDGTAALKAYLVAHDEVESQELYEFSVLPRPSPINSPDWLALPAPLDPGESFLWWPVTTSPVLHDGAGDNGIARGAGTGITITRHHESGLEWDVPTAIWSPPIWGVPPIPGGDAAITRIYSVVTGSYDGVAGFSRLLSRRTGYPGATYVWDSSAWGGSRYVLQGSLLWYWKSILGAPFPWLEYDLYMDILGSVFWNGTTVFETTDIGFLIYYASGPPPPPPTFESTRTALVTDASSPLTYQGKVYAPAHIKNNGFKSKIGVDVDALQLEWTFRGDEPMVTDPDTGATILTMLQGFKEGLWDGAWVKWRRTYMPTFGDCDTLGAVSSFRGRIAEVAIDRLTAKITVNSITDVFNRQIPGQLIESNNRGLQVGPGLPPDLETDPSHWTYFQCVDGHGGTVQKIVAQQTAPTADVVYSPGTYDFGYLWFQASPLLYYVAQVEHYEVIGGYNIFYLFRPLYVDPHPYGLTAIGFVPVPKDQTKSGSAGLELPGFPFVPLPEQAV